MATTYLHRTTTSTGSNTTATFSGWVKRAKTGVRHVIWAGWESSTERMVCGFESNDHLQMQIFTGGTAHDIETNRVFRDTSAWYHVVFQFNTSSGTEAERFKMFVNGVQETSFAVDDTIGQNIQMKMWGSTSQETIVGARKTSSYEHYFDGEMSHIHIIDGTVYAPTVFGETDATDGIWKIKTSPSVTYGTNGTFLLKDGAVTTDSSSNSNNYSTGGTLTATKDNPSNNFCTLNPLRPNSISQTYSNGNNTFIRTGTGGQMNGTLGVTSGKWYYECLIDDYWQYLGWTALSLNTSQTAACSDSGSGFYGLYSNATSPLTYANGTSTAQGSYTAMASGQIWGIAFDADNAKMYFSVNGVWENSSDPANQTNPAMSSIPVTDFLVPAIGQGTASRSSTIKINFGNGYFGTTAVTSAGTNASGNGTFEYDVPTGFTALSTKGLNE